LKVGDRIWAGACERYDVILDVAGTGAGRPASRRTWVLSLKFVLNLKRSIHFGRGGDRRKIAHQCSEDNGAAQKHDRENASISVKTSPAARWEVGWSDHTRVRMNTIAKRQTTAVRL
jgi:hypothetical protein